MPSDNFNFVTGTLNFWIRIRGWEPNF